LCTRNRPQELAGCLQSLSGQHYPGLQLLVVENGPPDGETRAVAEHHGARYLSSPRYGLSRARNDGARACSTDLVAFTDDDARPDPGWLQVLVREFADQRVMAATGEVRPPPESATAASSPPPMRGTHRVVDRETPHWFSLANFGGIGDGGNMCFRRSLFESWSGFDERLGRGAPLSSAEEHLAFFQLIRAGHRCAHAPEAIVRHRQPQNAEEWRRFQLANTTNAVAYAALLWSEYPQTRGLLLQHMWRRLWKRSPGQNVQAQRSGVPSPLSPWDKLRVIGGGLLLFARLPKARVSVTETHERLSAAAIPKAQEKDSQKSPR
jgi:cellulose synthase/poly-beta-1,6-N-acetylglucosamine synthase-like glycosyltransferase